ncbi:MAG: 2-oxo acid dehydrogenase subunit E2 [Anaerolineales bacterium]|nr:2-oxo acid dehydrogenase subunit E2 [Anaerolineales bacterium]
MSTDILMPPLSQTADTLVLTAWLKQVGDAVVKGEPLFEVETDKAVLTVEAPASGTLAAILAAPGSTVAVRTAIGTIGEDAAGTVGGTAAPPAAAEPVALRQTGPHANRLFASPRARTLAAAEGVSLAAIAHASGPDGLIIERDVRAYLAQRAAAPGSPEPMAATPVARRMAAAEGVDLAQIRPAGPVIRRADVAAAMQPGEQSAPTSGGSRRVPLSPTRRTIARRLQAVMQSAVPVTLTRDTDATELAALRARLLADLPAGSPRPTYTDFLAAIVARVLPQHPHFNAHFDGEALELFDAIHLGLAVDTDRGLLVPVLRDVAGQGLLALAQARTTLVERALAGTLTLADFTGGTFTLTNLGALGVDAFTPILNPPQVGILGIGRLRPVALPVGGVLAPRSALMLSLTFDHRAVDGAPAARFLGDLAALIEHPDRIWL